MLLFLKFLAKRRIFFDKEEYEKALPYLEMLIKIEPYFAGVSAYYELGLCYIKLGDYNKAIEVLIEIYESGRARYITPRGYSKIIEAFKQVIRIDPNNVDAHFGLGLTYFMSGDDSSALNEYKILKDLDINAANKLFDLIY